MTCGCSTFNYEWRREARSPIPADDITGRWEGTWVSTTTGHNGGLRSLIAREEDGAYRARFRATYKKFLSFSYTATLTSHPGTNGVHFRGSADLGKLAGGVYTYEGHATLTNFFSTYHSKADAGTFQMSRPNADASK